MQKFIIVLSNQVAFSISYLYVTKWKISRYERHTCVEALASLGSS